MSDPVTTISTQAAAAREGSRHQDGKFGTQVRADNTAPLSARNFHPTSQDTRVIGQWDVRDDWQADQLDDAFGQAPSPHATSAVRCVVCGRELTNVTLMESEDYGRFPLGSDCAQTVGLAAVLETGVAEIRASANREKVYEQHPWARALEELKDADRVMRRIHSDIGKYGRADPYRLDEVRWAAERAKGREVTREEIAEARRKINTDDAPGLAEAFEMRDRNKFIAQMYESAGHGPLTERQVYAAIGAAERERTKLVREIRHSAIKAAPPPRAVPGSAARCCLPGPRPPVSAASPRPRSRCCCSTSAVSGSGSPPRARWPASTTATSRVTCAPCRARSLPSTPPSNPRRTMSATPTAVGPAGPSSSLTRGSPASRRSSSGLRFLRGW